ncbi:MAG: EF-hand domain-containing protein [Planctomycetes bacterium]|nr:EF-hand domain-containing protein [Planctomycetota bacterium]
MNAEPNPSQAQPKVVRSGAAPANPAKKRSPIERIVVWVLIVGLLVVVGLEWRARHGYNTTMEDVQAAVDEAAAAKSTDAKGLTLAGAQDLISSSPSARRDKVNGLPVQVLKWRGPVGSLLGREYELHLVLSSADAKDPIVLGVSTPVDEAAETFAGNNSAGGPPAGSPMPMPGGNLSTSGPGDAAEEGHTAAGHGGPGGPGGPGGGGGGRRFELAQFDSDGDGKISPDEAPDRMKENFDRNDTNGDGFIGQEEFDALRERIRNRNAGGPGGDSGGDRGAGRPQRPDSDPASDVPSSENGGGSEQ